MKLSLFRSSKLNPWLLLLFMLATTSLITAQASENCDSGSSSQTVFNGNVTISSQTQMDAFIATNNDLYTSISGNLTVFGGGFDPINSFCELSRLRSVGGTIEFRNFNSPSHPGMLALPDLVYAARIDVLDSDAFNSIAFPELNTIISMWIQRNDNITEIDLGDLMDVGASFVSGGILFRDNLSLEAIELPSIADFRGFFNVVDDHPALLRILVNGESISQGILISDTESLNDLNFPALTSCRSLSLENNLALTSLDGFSQLETIGFGTVEIVNNPALSSCCLLPCNVTLNGSPINEDNPFVTISGNTGGCENEPILYAFCASEVSADYSFAMDCRGPGNRNCTFTFTANQDDATYRWTLNGVTVSTQRTYVRSERLRGSEEFCLTVITSCGEAKNCTGGIFEPGGDGGLGGFIPLGNVTNNSNKFNKLASSDLDLTSEIQFLASPNPFNEYLQVSINTKQLAYLKLFNTSGQQIQNIQLQDQVSKGLTILNLNTIDLPSGIYFLQAISLDGSDVITKKLIKE